MTDEIYGTYSHASPISLQIHWTDSAERFFEATFEKLQLPVTEITRNNFTLSLKLHTLINISLQLALLLSSGQLNQSIPTFSSANDHLFLDD